MSERVTWETCPHCRQAAAVGWVGDDKVEFHCPAGCRIPESGMACAFPVATQAPRRKMFDDESRHSVR
ncbi:hypothetical protein FHU33_3617 [Blastococcus colisei]|uniref:Uncharacterized protein n=1 Tax=Blastococcus colisei TaxID=1564162 RepID=A0A543PJ74_9ACTN|nr:hypothetical protein FHU33_3617 [Blastococcus colisei]